MRYFKLPIFVFILVLTTVAVLSLIPAAAVNASPANQTTQPSDCNACHPRSFTGEVHGLGINNPGFAAAWEAQGKSKDCLACHVTGYDPETGQWQLASITCQACHTPIPADHPDQNVPVNKSNELCASCHNDSRFGWDDWKKSVHYQQDMACSTCHDPHLPKSAASEAVSKICVECHQDISARSEHSTHSQAGVTCIKCHLGPKKGNDEYHLVPDHSFKPVVETCSACHAGQMHDTNPTAVFTPTQTQVVDNTPVAKATPTIAGPSQPSSSGLAVSRDGVTGLTLVDMIFFGSALLGIGAIGGLFLSPITRQLGKVFSGDGKK